MIRLTPVLLASLLVLPLALHAADSTPPSPPPPELLALQQALGGDDADAKRSALHALSDKSVGSDDAVLPVLVQAVGDRQASDSAIAALRSRTGLVPSAYVGQSHYPSYPSSDKPSDWNQWLSERTRDVEEKAKVKEALKTAQEAKKTAQDARTEAGDGKPGDAADKPKADVGGAVPVKPQRRPLAEDLGHLNRVVFKNGSSMICYILTRRTDADGNLLSLRVVHTDGSGEETLDAAMIARIETDVR